MGRFLSVLCSAAVLFGGGAYAKDVALVVSNASYQNAPNDRGISRDHDRVVSAYRDAGFETRDVEDAQRETLRAELARFVEESKDADRVLIHLNGHIVSFGQTAYFLGSDQDGVEAVDVLLDGLSLQGVMGLMRDHAGHATLITGEAEAALRLRDPITALGSSCNAPHGVLWISGTASDVNSAVRGDLLRATQTVRTLAVRYEDDLTFCGYVSSFDGIASAQTTAPTLIKDDTGMRNEKAAWLNAQRKNTIAGYNVYLEAFPKGIFTAIAREKIAQLKAEAQAPTPEEIEAQMALSRAERRQIQADLTLLGYNTRGVDGIFGRGSRSAIGNWQNDRGYPSTGFLTRDQVDRLDRQADAKRAEVEAADRAYWRDSGASAGREDGLRAYLKRYPNGIFADQAKGELKAIEDERRDREERQAWREARDKNTAAAYRDFLKRFPNGRFADRAKARLDEFRAEEDAQDDAAWNRAAQANTVKAYRDYLRQYPDGRHAQKARQRIEQMTGGGRLSDKELAEAKAREERLNTKTPGRLLIETRLQSLGYNIGRIDATFDKAFRRGLAQFQKDRQLKPTGYLTRATINQLLQ